MTLDTTPLRNVLPEGLTACKRYPSRRHSSPAFKLFVDALRYRSPEPALRPKNPAHGVQVEIAHGPQCLEKVGWSVRRGPRKPKKFRVKLTLSCPSFSQLDGTTFPDGRHPIPNWMLWNSQLDVILRAHNVS
jgi:hypothetical protein